MTFEPWHDNEILIRFEHILERSEDPKYSQTVQFNLKDVLRGFNIMDIRETTLDGNAWLGDRQRMQFVPDPEEFSYEDYAIYAKSNDFIQLQKASKPMLATEYHSEEIFSDGLGAENNRLKRSQSRNKQLNRLRAEELRKQKISVMDLPLQSDDDTKFIIELQPMQMRTYVLYLSPKN